jgi:hypothetical protein
MAPQVARCRLSLQQAAAGKILGQLAKPTYVSNTHSTSPSNAWEDEPCILRSSDQHLRRLVTCGLVVIVRDRRKY